MSFAQVENYQSKYRAGFRTVLVRNVRKGDPENSKRPDRLLEFYKLLFNKMGRLVQSFQYYPGRKERILYNYSYDLKKRLFFYIAHDWDKRRKKEISHIDYYRNGKIKSQTIYSFDSLGNCDLIRRETFRYEGNIEYTCLIEETEESVDSSKLVSVHNEKGELIEEKSIINRELDYWEKFEMDEENHICKTITLGVDGLPERTEMKKTIKQINTNACKISNGEKEDIWKYEYEYDERGNWITERFFEKGIHQKTSSREITYY
jgi:hypothetical protein